MPLRTTLLVAIVVVALVALSCGSSPQKDLALPPDVDAYTGASPKPPPKGVKKQARPFGAPAADAGVGPDAGVTGAKPTPTPAPDAGV